MQNANETANNEKHLFGSKTVSLETTSQKPYYLLFYLFGNETFVPVVLRHF